MAHRGDHDIRDYFSEPLVSRLPVTAENTSLTNVLKAGTNVSEYSDRFYEFSSDDGLQTLDMFREYQHMFEYIDGYLVHITFDDFAAKHFSCRWHALAKYLYGNVQMFWTIPAFNDVKTPTDMNINFLRTKGITVPSEKGLNFMKKIHILNKRILAQLDSSLLFETIEEE
jgi:hypothetical protein